ncbi:MAG: flagellar basal body-associated FliL family protein [Desulfovibrio sp.]|nr:flagellar basal body-associated FliL family protein [Desulfovibrio sp.]
MADKTRPREVPADNEVQVAESGDLSHKKVQLDLDDAPFLSEKEQAPPPAEGDSVEQDLPEGAEDAAPKQGTGRKKLIILAGGAGLLLLAALAAGWWFFLREPPPPSPEAAKPEVIVVPSKPATQAKPDYTKEFSPFLVYHSDGAGGRFLVCKFATLTKVQNLNREMDQKMLFLRDAVYYYLRSKTPEYLTNFGSLPEIKKDLTAVINNYLTQGQIEDILFESYLNE